MTFNALQEIFSGLSCCSLLLLAAVPRGSFKLWSVEATMRIKTGNFVSHARNNTILHIEFYERDVNKLYCSISAITDFFPLSAFLNFLIIPDGNILFFNSTPLCSPASSYLLFGAEPRLGGTRCVFKSCGVMRAAWVKQNSRAVAWKAKQATEAKPTMTDIFPTVFRL